VGRVQLCIFCAHPIASKSLCVPLSRGWASSFDGGKGPPGSAARARLRFIARVRYGTRLAIYIAMPEPLICPCCDSTRVVILSIQCKDCGIVIIRDPRDQPDEAPQVREKLDRRRQPRP
jgi:hypothetical protein